MTLLKKLLQFVLKVLNPMTYLRFLIRAAKAVPAILQVIKGTANEVLITAVLMLVYLINLPVVSLLKLPFIPHGMRSGLLGLNRLITSVVYRFDPRGSQEMGRLELFELAFRSMTFKKTRTFITIGGMALGVGAIVFLVSIGYGLQKLVIDRVARLDELRQADVAIQPGSNVYLTNDSVAAFKDIQNVSSVLPIVGVVAKVNYQGSVSDVAVYGVTTDYLKNSAIRTTQGVLFESYEISAVPDPLSGGVVAGTSVIRTAAVSGQKIGEVSFTIFPKSWVRVRKEASVDSELLGFTKRAGARQQGDEHWGSTYMPDEIGKIAQDMSGNWLGRWVRADVYLWKEEKCEIATNSDCEDGQFVPLVESGRQVMTSGYFAETELALERSVDVLADDRAEVLGWSAIGNETAVLAAETSVSLFPVDAEGDFVSMVSETSASAAGKDVKRVALPYGAQKEAVINEALVKILGLTNDNPVGKTFDASFIVTSNLIGGDVSKLESEFASYRIVGVIPGDSTPFFYVPLQDLRSLGVSRFSQVRVVSNATEDLATVRDKIGAMGFVTSSVVDTVEQITRLFGTIRVVLGLLGAVALGVASLGMFNTLTVSLLERTREVGLMKAMGMTSDEVKKLFLTESLLMGFVGGILGILFGFVSGKLISIMLSIFSVMKGAGFLDVSYIPGRFVTLVFLLSLFVGIITGVYPARRATKISALNALRYE